MKSIVKEYFNELLSVLLRIFKGNEIPIKQMIMTLSPLAIILLMGFYLYFRFKKYKREKLKDEFSNIKIPIIKIKKKKTFYKIYTESGIIKEDLEQNFLRISEILDVELATVERIKKSVFKVYIQNIPDKAITQKGDLLKVPIAVNNHNETIFFYLMASHLFITSPARSGKSVFALMVILEIIKVHTKIDIIICDYKDGADFSSLAHFKDKDLEYRQYHPTRNIDAFIEELETLEKALIKAARMRREIGADNDLEIMNHPDFPYRPSVILLDEIERYASTRGLTGIDKAKRERMNKLVNDLVGTTGANLIYFIGATQSSTIASLGLFQSVNFTSRIFGNTSKESLKFYGITQEKFSNRRDFRHGKFLYQSDQYEAQEVRTIFSGTNAELLRRWRK